jgi:hypothetical protein
MAPATTLTLQLLFDPSNDTFTNVGRFLPDPGDTYTPQTPLNERSKIWIFVDEDGSQIVVPDSNGYSIQMGDDSPSVQIRVLKSGTDGEFAEVDGYALRIAAVFGRAHRAPGKQDYASPFALKGSRPPVVGATFQADFDKDHAGAKEGCMLVLGQPEFYDGTSADLYEFNIGVTAHIRFQSGQTVTYTFGHDPNLEVGN